MRQNLTLLVFFCSLYGFAQLYVQEGTTLSLGSSEAILSSQETLNKIDGPIIGEGTLLLNSSSAQQLTSSQVVLELPTLHIENAHDLHIDIALNIHNQLQVDSGQLTLSKDIQLPDPTALVLGEDASISKTQGQLVYHTQFSNTQPLVFLHTQPLLKFIEPKTPPTPNSVVLDFIQRSNFGPLTHTNYNWNFKPYTPPPKAV